VAFRKLLLSLQSLFNSNFGGMLHKEDEVLWYAMRVPYRNELKVQSKLQDKGIESFVPKRKKLVKRRGKTYYELLPAVNNLIFVHTSLSIIKEVKKEIENLQYIVNKCLGGNDYAIVRDEEMQQFIKVVESFDDEIAYLSPDEVNIEKGTRIRVIGGKFNGVEGIFVKVKGKRSKRVVIMLEGFLAVVMAEVDTELIEVIKN
jgi:transcription antitermination factor NusG